jgi:hypothetical protein
MFRSQAPILVRIGMFSVNRDRAMVMMINQIEIVEMLRER